MRYLLVLVITLLFKPALADEAYIVLDAVKVPTTSKQPTWIALEKSGKLKFVYVAVGESIVSVKPGKFTISHVDFSKNRLASIGTIINQNPEAFTFEAVPNAITYVGLIQIKRNGWNRNGEHRFTLKLDTTDRILSWACHQKPKLFKRLPLRIPQQDDTTKILQIKCET